MEITPRLIRPDEVDALIDLSAIGFGIGPVAPDEYRAEVRPVLETDRCFVVDDRGRLVATASAYSFSLALPGGGALPFAAVSEAVVLPTHRRRGMLSSLLGALADQAVERGEPLAALTASEGGIYRRFGYGVATRFHSLRLDAHRAAEVAPLVAGDAGAGALRLVSEAEAAAILPAVWERHWRRTPGEVSRTPGVWQSDAVDSEHPRAGATARYLAVHDDRTGTPDGFLVYRLVQGFGTGGPRHELRIVSLAAADEAVEAELLRYAVAVDLVATVTWVGAPTDLGLRWRLADARSLEVTAESDLLWLRLLDVPACLAGRTYAAAGGLVVEVVDDRRPEVGGRFLLDAGTDGAACARTDREPEVAVRAAELGSLLLGGVSWRALGRAGLVDERAPGALSRADALFRSDRAPWCATDF
jgi:predicted acetyltransferase